MGQNARILKYAKENFSGVLHTTLNPKGPGAVRIHLIPPRIDENQKSVNGSVAIINGQDIIPVNSSWTILLCEFIKSVNKYEGAPISDFDFEEIMKSTQKGVRKVFPFLNKDLIRGDLQVIMNTFANIAYRKEVPEDIEYIRLGDYAPYMKAPHRMDLMVSAMTKNGLWNCNQKCIHCYAAGQIHAEEKELSTKEWFDIIDKCKEAGIPQLTFTGGEPTLRDDLIELIDHSQWFITRLNTNGIKLTKEYCQKLKDASLDSLQITFYSNEKDIHNKLVGADRYDAVIEGIKNAVGAGLSVSVNTPLCVLNKEYKKTLEFLHSLGVMYVTCSGLITTGNAGTGSSERMQLSADEVKDILREATQYCFENEMEISFTSPGWLDSNFCDEIGITMANCGACLSNMAITPSGNVVPCQSWLSEESLGNMLSDSFESIWESPICKERRDFSAKMLGVCPLRKKEDK